MRLDESIEFTRQHLLAFSTSIVSPIIAKVLAEVDGDFSEEDTEGEPAERPTTEREKLDYYLESRVDHYAGGFYFGQDGNELAFKDTAINFVYETVRIYRISKYGAFTIKE